jgi:hypothetical protein
MKIDKAKIAELRELQRRGYYGDGLVPALLDAIEERDTKLGRVWAKCQSDNQGTWGSRSVLAEEILAELNSESKE